MNNKPVAWMLVDEINGDYMLERHPSGDYDWFPLYNHPVKELTDEEIMEIVADKYEKGHGRYIDTKLFFVEFAKAILRKAQEK